ncbi:MAG: GSU2403 family nucleotidyltransferase fold protein [Eubacteriales bacterium]
MSNEKELFNNIISILENLGVLKHLLLIGSWAEYVYQISYLDNFRANLRTRDVDLLIMNLGYPQEKVDIKKVLEEQGLIYEVDRVTGVTKFFHETLEVEFLARELGAGQTEPYVSHSLGIKIEGLRNVDMLIDSQIQLLLGRCLVNVPTPHAYVLHKLLIWPKRGVKQDKDMRAIENLLDTIEQHEIEKRGLKKMYLSLTPKQTKAIDEVCKENLIKLFEDQF